MGSVPRGTIIVSECFPSIVSGGSEERRDKSEEEQVRSER